MKNIRVGMFSSQPYDEVTFKQMNETFGLDITYFKERLKPHNTILAKGMDAVCIFVNDIANKEVIDNLVEYGVKILALRCAGFNNVDLEAAKGRLKVVRVPAYSPYAVAEYALALILSLNRKIPRAFFRTRDGNFSLDGLMGFDLHNKNVGIIGVGKIAKVLIRILHGLDCKIYAFDPYPDKAFEAQYPTMKYVELDELFNNSHIISLHCPLTPSTKYIINKNSINKMKNGVMIINTGRGELIHTEDLIEGLKSKKIGYAGLDVYEEESHYFYKDRSNKIIADDNLARLLSFNNVILTSHQAFFTKEATDKISITTLQNITDFFMEKDLINEVKITS